mmetsp:Transcript_16458/g.57531  ORF Transcript_16458/g.57531 Transcript_16458/m.57531 type:complete len:904 (-) Transcript_16458:487-3198(-)
MAILKVIVLSKVVPEQQTGDAGATDAAKPEVPPPILSEVERRRCDGANLRPMFVHATAVAAVAIGDLLFGTLGANDRPSSLSAVLVVLYILLTSALGFVGLCLHRGLCAEPARKSLLLVPLGFVQVLTILVSGYWRDHGREHETFHANIDVVRVGYSIAFFILLLQVLYDKDAVMVATTSGFGGLGVIVLAALGKASPVALVEALELLLVAGLVASVYECGDTKRLHRAAVLFLQVSNEDSSVRPPDSPRSSQGEASSPDARVARIDDLRARIDSARQSLTREDFGPELQTSLDTFMQLLARDLKEVYSGVTAPTVPDVALEHASKDMIDYVQNTLRQQPCPSGVRIHRLAVPGSAVNAEHRPAGPGSAFNFEKRVDTSQSTDSTFAGSNDTTTTGLSNQPTSHRTSASPSQDLAAMSEMESIGTADSKFVSQGELKFATPPIMNSNFDVSAQSVFAWDQSIQAMMQPLCFREEGRSLEPPIFSADFQAMLMQALGTWRFDVFTIAQACDGRPLIATGKAAIGPLAEAMNIDLMRLDRFLAALEERYLVKNSYHNATHAADVLNTMLYWIRVKGFGGRAGLAAPEKLAALCAAAAHDVGHTGMANRFLVSAEMPLAMLFNDQSVLENMHCCIAFVVLQADPCNLLSDLEPSAKATFRCFMIEMILATDLAKHFQMVNRFKQDFLGKAHDDEGRAELEVAQRRELLAFTLKASDVAGSSKPFELHAQWTMRIMGEFFAQGDAEQMLGLPCSPFCDRRTTNVSESQTGFFDFIVTPLYSALSEYLGSGRVGVEVVPEIGRNREFWKRYDGKSFNYDDPCMNWDVLRRAYVAFHDASVVPGASDGLDDALGSPSRPRSLPNGLGGRASLDSNQIFAPDDGALAEEDLDNPIGRSRSLAAFNRKKGR